MAHGNYGLSLLSRGVGEQRHSGKSHKVEVLLEPEDYFNIQRKGYYLPPIHHQAWANEELSPRTVHAHKTYTTRKGALLLYAEDLALSHPAKHRQKARRKSLEAEDSKYFNTMKDLRSAVLSYGAKDQQGGNVFMGFNNSKMNNFNSPRSVRPGFSAKRYLANWSKSWDDSILNYLRSEGHLWDKNLFENNSVMPGLYRRINDDMSHVPPPYRVTRNMLLSPGDIVTYEFYRIRPDDMEYGTGDSLRHGQQPHPSPETAKSTTSGMIAAIARDGEQKPHPVLYSQLDRSEQQLVLQKLILQSAAHHNQGKLENIQADLPDSQVMILDMDQAITNLITSNSENLLAGGKVFSIPEVPTEEPYSDSTPSESSWPDVVEKEVYEEVAPQIPKSASFSSVEPLPPIAVPKQQTLDLMGSAQSTRLSHGQIDFRLPEISKGSPLPGIGVQPTTESVQELKTGRNEDVSDAQYSEVNPSEEKHEEDETENETVTFTPQQTDSRQREMSSERKESDSRISSSSQLSQSFEDLNLADEQLTSMKGGVVPKNRTEGMRSYKGSRGRGSAGSHRSEILQGDEDLISVVGSVISAPSERAVSDTGGADKASKEEAMKDTTEEGEEEDVYEKEEEKASMVSSSRGPIEIPTGSELSGDQEEQTESGAEVTGPRKIADSQESVNKEDSKLAESIENKSSDYKTADHLALKDTGDSSKDDVAAALEDGEVGESAEIHQKPASRASGMEVMDSKDPSIIPLGLDGASGIGGTTGVDGASGLDVELEVDGATMVQPVDADEKAPSASPHQEMGSSQKLPTASIGSDLAEDAAVSENSFPKSKTRTSVPSEAGSVRSVQDGIFSMSEFFTNFSYKGRRDSDRSSWWSGRGSMPSSLASDADDTEIASLAGDSAATGDGWPQVDEEKDQTTSDQSTALPSSREDDVLKSDEADSEARLVNDDSLMIQSNLRQSEDVHPELDAKSVSDIGEEGSAVLSQKSDEMARHTSSRASSLMDQLEDEAAAVAKAVLQRPMSGRDLAEDAQLAAALWRERLGQLFQVARPPPDDTRSMIERRRKNSLDGSSVASFDLGHWDGSDLSTGRKLRSRRERRVSSAQAAVDLTDELSGHLRAVSLADSEVKVIITLSEDEADGDDESEVLAAGAVSVRDEMSRASARVETKPKSALSVRLGSSQSGRHSSASILPESGENIEVAPTPSLQEPPPLSQSPTPSRGSAKSVRSESSQSSRKSPSVLQRSEGFGEIRSDSRKSSSHSRSKSATSIPDRAPSPSENENENLTAKIDSLDQPVSQSETGEDGELEMNSSNPPKTAFSEGSVQESLTKGESTASAEEIPKETAISAEKDEVPPSAPQQNLSGGDSLQLDVTNFGVGERGDVTTKSSQRRESESKEDEELKKIVEDAGLLSRTSETASTKKSKGSKSSKSQKSDKSSTKSGKSQKSGKDSKNADKTKEFIVSMPHDDKEDYLAYKPAPEPEPKVPPETGKAKLSAPKPPPKKQKKEKAKKAKKAKKADAPKKEEPAAAKKDEEKDEKTPAEMEKEKVEEAVEDTEESSKDAEPQKDDGDAAENSEEEDKQEEEEDATREEVESPEFIIIHEEFSDSEPEEEEPQPVVEQSSAMESHEEAYMSEVETEYTENSAHRPGSLSRSQARAAKRAAESERKKREIDRKRREKEEARRKAQEEEERKERIKREFEEERRKKEEQIRLKKEAEEEAKRKAEQAQRDRARQAELAAERERKQQEEYKRRLEEMAKKKKEEEKLRQEMEAQRLKEEAERKKEEEEMLAKMEEEERLEYERQKREEELLAQIKAEEERVRREIEAKLAQEEAERLALEMAKRQKELEMRMQFNRELNAEANIFAHSQEVTRAFTWSYFELLEYLGIPIPAHLREKYLKGQLVSQNHQEMHGETKESEDG